MLQFYEPLVKKINTINLIAKSHLLQNILMSKMLNVRVILTHLTDKIQLKRI